MRQRAGRMVRLRLQSESTAPESRSAVVKSDVVKPAETLDGSIEQARVLRQTGNHQEAIRHLSQLMIVASDDGRVVSEYGKALVETGRAQEGVNFLTRAEQLRPTDWTIFSALGVAHDQLGNHKDARTAYERALTLQPEEASVLNNYALSRMLAKDPETARTLIARARIRRRQVRFQDRAQHRHDPRHGRPRTWPRPPPTLPSRRPSLLPLPRWPCRRPLPKQIRRPKSNPHRLRSIAAKETKPAVATAAPQAPSGVVMQRVPVDPLAGPVAATRPPRPLVITPANTDIAAKPALKPAVPVKAAEAKTPAIEAKPGAVKAAEAKPAADTKAAPVKAAETKAAPVPTIKPAAAVKAAELKPSTDAKGAKTAEAKPAPAPEAKPLPGQSRREGRGRHQDRGCRQARQGQRAGPAHERQRLLIQTASLSKQERRGAIRAFFFSPADIARGILGRQQGCLAAA